MMHASKERLVALADGELDGPDEEMTVHHVERCLSCAAALAELRETRAAFAAVLDQLDAAEPPEWAAAIEATETLRAQRPSPAPAGHSPGLNGTEGRPGRGAPWRSSWRWAAGLIFFSGVAAAAVLDPSLVARLTGGPSAERHEPARQPPSGVSVMPLDGAVEIDLRNAAPGTRVRIGFHGRSDVGLVSFATTTPSFVVRAGALAVELGGEPMTLRVALPADLRAGKILADGVVVAAIEDGRVVPLRADRGIVIEDAEPDR